MTADVYTCEMSGQLKTETVRSRLTVSHAKGDMTVRSRLAVTHITVDVPVMQLSDGRGRLHIRNVLTNNEG